jgi:hypothetical protein
MKLTEENRSTRGKTCPRAILSTTDPTRTEPGMEPGPPRSHVLILPWSTVNLPFCTEPFRPTVGHTQPPIEGVPGFFPGLNLPGRELTTHLYLEQRLLDEWRPNCTPPICLHGVDKVNCTCMEPTLENAKTACRTHTSNFMACLKYLITRHGTWQLCPVFKAHSATGVGYTAVFSVVSRVTELGSSTLCLKHTARLELVIQLSSVSCHASRNLAALLCV